MAVFTGFATAVAMEFFFDLSYSQGSSSLSWNKATIAQSSTSADPQFVLLEGWTNSSAKQGGTAAFYVIEGNFSVPESKITNEIKGTVNSFYEELLTVSGSELFWQVYLEDGIDTTELFKSQSLGAAMRNIFKGNDEIKGSTEADTLYGYTGDDSLFGKDGNDVYYIDSLNDKAIENSNEGADSVYSLKNWNGGLSPESEIEIIICIKKCKNITGTETPNTIFGNEEKNTLNGGGGEDTIFGAASHPLIPGATKLGLILENDKINGDNGNDLIFGFGGKDILTGGAGNDIFLFNTPANNKTAAKITDFNPAEDKIAFEWTSSYKELTGIFYFSFSSDLKAQYNQNKPASDMRYALIQSEELKTLAKKSDLQSIDENDRIIYLSSTGEVYFDADGSGSEKPKLVTRIGKNLSLTEQNILVYSEKFAFPEVYPD